MKRTYKKYAIRIIDDSGSRIVKINKNVDMTNFTVARDTYAKSKDIYTGKNETVTIELVGMMDNEIGNVIYSKQFFREIQEEDADLLKFTDDLVDNIKNSIETLMRKREYHTDLVCALNKKQDVILHNIENISQFEDDRKLEIIKELEEVRKYRRFHKTEQKKLQILDVLINLSDINDLFNKVEIPIDTEDYKYLNKSELDDMRIMKEVVYLNEKDRIHKMEQLRKKYDKIVVDAGKNIIICYNKGYVKSNKLR